MTTGAAPSVERFRIKIFADGADLDGIRRATENPLISGFTTNPTLMRKAGVADYVAFAHEALAVVAPLPISFEVFADEPDEMQAQAREIASWGDNVYVKIPVTTCAAASCCDLIGTLSSDGVKLNITAIMSVEQVATVAAALDPTTPAVVSVFAGRIADTGRDPMPIMRESLSLLSDRPLAELLWASPREVLNLFQADEVGAHIITVTDDLLAKLENAGKGLEQFSVETVQMFFRDASAAGYDIPVAAPAPRSH